MTKHPSNKAKELILSEKAPEGLRVDGYMYLGGCTSLKSLPEGLRVDGYLSLYKCTSLKSLPQGLQVGGFLSLYECSSLVIDHWDVHVDVDVVYWDEDVASRVPIEILPLMIAVKWGDEESEGVYRKRLA